MLFLHKHTQRIGGIITKRADHWITRLGVKRQCGLLVDARLYSDNKHWGVGEKILQGLEHLFANTPTARHW